MAPPRKPFSWCSVDGCGKPSKYKDLCGKHYKREWRHGNPTLTLIRMNNASTICEALEDCGLPASKGGLCDRHYNMYKNYGRTIGVRARNGLGTINTAGYRVLTENGQREYEHILIAEEALGKPLPPKAIIHHVTEDKSDNFGWCKLVICPDQAYHLLIHRLMREKGISFKTGWPND